MFARIVPDIIDKYGLDSTRIGNVQKGYRSESYPLLLSDGTTVNLLFYKHEIHILDRIKTADYVAGQAFASELPVRTRYDQRLLRIGDRNYVGVYNYLPGTTISWEAYTKKHIKLVGWAMADLHTALKSLPAQRSRLLSDEMMEQIDRMERYFRTPAVVDAIQQKLGVKIDTEQFDPLQKLIDYSAKSSGQQYLHMDMVRGNILFDEARPNAKWQIDDIQLSGIIDFEKAAYGLPVCDVARTLAFLLVDCPKPTDKIYKYFLDSGYHKRGGATLEHIDLLPHFIRLFLIHDFYKFLKHTPYESLHDNYHYNRTRDILKTYGIIS